MKKPLITFVLSVIAQTALATNGDNMIGIGAITSAMGGCGIALDLSSESILKNPAFLAPDDQFEMNFAGKYFAPNVKAQNNMAGAGFQQFKSKADKFMIPALGFSNKINDEFSFGLGAYGTAGMGVDYRDTNTTDGLFKMGTSLSIMKFTPAVAYESDDFKLGIGLPIVYGALGITYDLNAGAKGHGVSDHIGTGVNLGFAYNVDNVTFGAVYQSPITMKYNKQLTNPATDFQLTSIVTSDTLQQPAEYGIGLGFVNEPWTTTFDVKNVAWNKATGYKQFGWKSQYIYCLGLAYDVNNNVTLRAGYNYGKSPLGDNAVQNTVGGASQSLNALNLVGFPAIVENHLTGGFGYKFNKHFNLDAALQYSPKKTVTSPGVNMGLGNMPFTISHSQVAATVAGRWLF